MTGVAPLHTLRESVMVRASRAPLWRLHRERLTEGGIGPDVVARVEAAVLGAVRAAPPAVVGLDVLVSPAGAFRIRTGTGPSSLAVPGGPALVPVDVRVPPRLPPRAAKPADRAYWDGPMRLAQLRGGGQAVLVARDGTVVDGGTATVWALVGGVLVTPPAPAAVAGVARRFILREVAPLAGVPTAVRPLDLAELRAADEALLSNAVGGLVAARGRGGPIAAALRSTFDGLLLGEESDRVADGTARWRPFG